jgi:hypothetical protein
MRLGVAALLLVTGGLAVFGLTRGYVNWLFRACEVSSTAYAVCVGLLGSALLFVANLLPLIAILIMANGTEWLHPPRWYFLLAAWLLAMAPGIYHLSRNAHKLTQAARTRWPV